MTKSIVRLPAIQLLCVLGALSWLAAPKSAAAPSAADRLPEETVVYLRIQNTSELVDRYRQTALGMALQDPQVQPLIEHLWSSVVPTLEKIEAQAGVGLDELAKAAPGQLVLAMVSVPEMPPAGVIMFQPQRPEELDKTLERGDGRLQELGFAPSSETVGGAEVRILTREDGPIEELIQLRLDDWRIITTNRDVAAALVGLWRGEAIPCLSDYPAFRTIMSRCTSEGSPSQIDWYVDPIETVRAITRGNLAAAAAMAVLPVIGADGLQAIGGRITIADDDYDAISRTHILLEPPRDGILKLLALQQGSTDPEKWVPADVATYVTWHIDLQNGYATLNDVVNSVRGEGALSGIVKRRVSEPLGVDFEDEVLPLLAGRATHIVRFEQPVSLTSQTQAIGIELTDGEKFREPWAKIVKKLGDSVERSSFAGVDIYQWTREPSRDGAERPAAEGDDRRSARGRNRAPGESDQAVAQPQPTAAVVGNYLVVADRLSLMQHVIMTWGDSQARLQDELDFKFLVGKLKAHSTTAPSMIRFERPDEGLRFMYQLLQTDDIRQKVHDQRDRHPFFKTLDEMLTDNRLPPFEVFSQYLAPSGSMLVNEESGLHHVSFGLRRNIKPALRQPAR